MKPFLDYIADYINEQHTEDSGEIAIVFPNRRAIRFLKNSIAKSIKKQSWLPDMFSMDDFIYHFSDFEAADRNTQLIELFKIHRAKNPENTDSEAAFEDFLNWGAAVIQDFNEIDMYQIDAKAVFSYLSETKAIQLWSPDKNVLSDFQKDYLKFYQSLFSYYEHFKSRLEEKEMAYQGMAFRDFAEKITEGEIQLPYKKILFCGFNALTRSERNIIHELLKTKQAEIFFDADAYYVDNPKHEAGLFIRELKEEFNLQNLHRIEENFKKEKKIEIIGVPKQIGQAKLCGKILQDIKSKEKEIDINDTVVLMNDESLLEAILQSIPPEYEQLNVSLGYPLGLSPAFQFFQDLFQLYISAQENKDSKQLVFYHKHLNKILLHPYLALATGDKKNIVAIRNEMLQKNTSMLPSQKLQKIMENHQASDLYERFFSFSDDTQDFLQAMDNLCFSLLEANYEKNSISKLEQESILAFQSLLKQIYELIKTYALRLRLKTCWKLIKDNCNSESIALIGEPLQGLQIMGMLESRNLSFKRLIMLSVNEGILPLGKTQQSFIPMQIKRDFGLPDFHRKEAVYAFHFYRLLQSAEEVFLLYNTETDSLGAGEKSRYIQQLLYELPSYNPDINIRQGVLQLKPDVNENNWIAEALEEIHPKEEKIQEALARFFERGISPSALNTYISCPKKFYFRYILSLHEIEEIEESIDERNIGSIIHNVLEDLYQEHKSKTLSVKDVDAMLEKYKALTLLHFEKQAFGEDKNYGKTLLMREVVHNYIAQFLKKEKKRLETHNIQIIGLEEVLECQIDKYHFKGKADRIDIFDGKHRIIDYKSGKYNPKTDLKMPKEKIKNISAIIGNYAMEKNIQMILYILMYSKTNPQLKIKEMEAGMHFLQQSSKDFVALDAGAYAEENSFKAYEDLILAILEEMETAPFTAMKEKNKCSYCPYQNICH
jgi:CRISPR/Cas system-associated exonuclease Cas4 (RecB family)